MDSVLFTYHEKVSAFSVYNAMLKNPSRPWTIRNGLSWVRYVSRLGTEAIGSVPLTPTRPSYVGSGAGVLKCVYMLG